MPRARPGTRRGQGLAHRLQQQQQQQLKQQQSLVPEEPEFSQVLAFLAGPA